MSFAIMVTDARGGNRIELCRVSSNPKPVAEAARLKTHRVKGRGGKWLVFRTYIKVEIIDLAAKNEEARNEG